VVVVDPIPEHANKKYSRYTKSQIMKTKTLILIAFAAIITLSFSFATTSRSEKVSVKETAITTSRQQTNEPIGGFISEDKL
jgi:hypothetical protein